MTTDTPIPTIPTETPAPSTILSEDQEQAAQKFLTWLEQFPNTRKKFFVLAGYAGTGKTFVVKELVKRTGLKAQYMAYTGKAALVLNKYSKVNATTIHSAIYKLRVVSDTVFEKMFQDLEKATGDAKKDIQRQIEELQKPVFDLNDEALEGVELIVLDECSMVDTDILNDLLSFEIPIIALGDPGQLPPVNGVGALFQSAPDAQLTEIRRQALESPIIQWSMWARMKRTLPTTDPTEWATTPVCKIPKGMIAPAEFLKMMADHDITICWKNATRMQLNNMRRKALGFQHLNPVYPVIGDKLIITKNDKETGLFNGQFVTVKDFGREFDNYIETIVEVEGQEDKAPIKLNLHRVTFEEYHDADAKKKYRPWDFRGTHMADFGYAITCHKAQGSQWDKVLVLEENVFNWPDKYAERAQWLYTAITRTVEKLTIIAGKF